MITDADLCRQALRGERSALSELARRSAGRVLAICRARVGRDDVAEELAQESLLRALRSLSKLASPESFGAWIRGIAERVAIDWLKSPQRKQVQFSSLAADGMPDFPGDAERSENAAERKEELSRLAEEIDRLPEECREVLMLFYYDEMTYDQLAEFLGVSRTTINARLAHGRRMLRLRLSASAVTSENARIPAASVEGSPPSSAETDR